MALDPIRVADTRAWLLRAADDLRAAEADLAIAPPLLGDAAFHCQQAIEKSLKAFLTWHDHPFRRTHDLAEIGTQCVEIDPTLEPLRDRAAPLTEYAWRFRYPGDAAAPTAEEVDTALALAREIRDAVLARLPEATRA